MLSPSFPSYQQEVSPSALEPFTVEDAVSDLPRDSALEPDSVLDYGGLARSAYQQWSRGQIALDDLVPPVEGRPAETQLVLL